jgi:Polyphosphate kinase 2 (PPK2)
LAHPSTVPLGLALLAGRLILNRVAPGGCGVAVRRWWDYTKAYQAMLAATDTPVAPWYGQ